MLILTRRLGETICIGDGIRVTVTGVREPDGEVSLGVEIKMPEPPQPTKNEEKP